MLRSALLRFFRCHPATYIVTALVGIALVLIIIPGDQRHAPYRQPFDWWEQQCVDTTKEVDKQIRADQDDESPKIIESIQLYEHGWPRPWLVRGIRIEMFSPYKYSTPLITSGKKLPAFLGPSYLADYVSWSNYANWPLASEAWRIHPWHFVLDFLLAFVVAGSVGLVTEWWLRSRGGLLRFRIVDLLGAITVCALLLGWWAYHERMTEVEREVEEHFTSGAHASTRNWGWKQYAGPEWLRKLVGDDAYLPFLHHNKYARWWPDGEEWRSDIEQFVRLPRLEHVSLTLPVPQHFMHRLRECPRLQQLKIHVMPAGQDKVYAGLDLESDSDFVSVRNLDAFGKLEVKEVTLDVWNALCGDVERLLAATTLTRLHLDGVAITPEELSALRQRFPQTAISVKWAIHHRDKPPPEHADRVEKLKRERKAKRVATDKA